MCGTVNIKYVVQQVNGVLHTRCTSTAHEAVAGGCECGGLSGVGQTGDFVNRSAFLCHEQGGFLAADGYFGVVYFLQDDDLLKANTLIFVHNGNTVFHTAVACAQQFGFCISICAVQAGQVFAACIGNNCLAFQTQFSGSNCCQMANCVSEAAVCKAVSIAEFLLGSCTGQQTVFSLLQHLKFNDVRQSFFVYISHYLFSISLFFSLYYFI